MKSCRHLLLVCLTLLPAGSMPYMERVTTDLQEHLVSPPITSHNFTKNQGVMAGTKLHNTRYIQTFLSYSLRNLEDFSLKNGEALTTLLVSIVKAELSKCTLGIVWDSELVGSTITDDLSFLPNVKQLVGDGEIDKLLWRANQCRGYILLLTDPSSLMDQAEYASHDAWDYSGRMIIAGLSRAHIETLTRTRKGRKTEHIIGIVQNKPGHFVVFTNLLYKKDRLSRIFTWQSPGSSNPRYSTELNIKPKIDPDTKSFVMNQRTPSPVFQQQLFPDKTRNLQGSTLNVGTFHFPPEIMYRYDAHGNVVMRYGGNVRMVEAVSEVFNFTVSYSEPKGALWGYELPNGTWTGLVGMFASGEADIGIANLFISALGGRHVHQGYTAPYGQQSTCFLIARGTRMPRWQSLGLPFKRDTWIAVLVMALCAGPVFFALSRSRVTSEEILSRQSLAFITLYTFGVHLKIAQTQIPVRVSLQVFVAFLWIYVIIVLEAYTAKLVSFLTVERIPEGINTFEDLYKNSLPVYGNTPFYKESLSLAKNIYARKVAPQYTTVKDFDDVYEYVISGQGSYMASSNNLIYIKSLFSKNGIPILRLMKECYQPFSTALGVPTHSPLKKNMDPVVTWIAEAGLPESWMRETLMFVRQERRAASNDSADDPAPESGNRVSFTLEHLQGVFIMFGVGCGLSLLVFVSELLL